MVYSGRGIVLLPRFGYKDHLTSLPCNIYLTIVQCSGWPQLPWHLIVSANIVIPRYVKYLFIYLNIGLHVYVVLLRTWLRLYHQNGRNCTSFIIVAFVYGSYTACVWQRVSPGVIFSSTLYRERTLQVQASQMTTLYPSSNNSTHYASLDCITYCITHLSKSTAQSANTASCIASK